MSNLLTGKKSGGTIIVPSGINRIAAGQRFYWPRGLHDVTIRGEPGAVIDGGGMNFFMHLTDNWRINIRGIEFRNWKCPITMFTRPGQPGAAYVTIADCEFTGSSVANAGLNGRAIQIADYDETAPSSHHINILGCRIDECSEVGIKIMGGPTDVVIRDVTISSVSDGRGTSGDGDGVTVLAKGGRLPRRVLITDVVVDGASEDGLDLTGEDITVDNVRTSRCGARGVAVWAPGLHDGPMEQGRYKIGRLHTSDCGRSGLEVRGGPVVNVSNSVLVGGEAGLRVCRKGMPWNGPVTASYCLWSRLWLEDNAVLIQDHTGLADLRADFNSDGRVDGLDFLIWQAHYMQHGGKADGDANGDGRVDGLDFLIWQSAAGRPAD